MTRPAIHVEVRGLDQPGSAEFYRRVFGWEHDASRSVEGYAVVDLGPVNMTAAVGTVPDWQARSATFYIEVDDLDAALVEIERAGGTVVMPRVESPPEFPEDRLRVFPKFVDPAGNIVGLVQAVDRERAGG